MVSRALGSKLFAFACGNEPDLYTNNGNRVQTYSVGEYVSQVSTCLQTIHAAAPKAKLEGPDTSGSRRYFTDFAAAEKPLISWLGQHYYPMGCEQQATGSDASLVGKMLSPGLAAQEATTFSWYVAAAKKDGVRLVISETNSACGGGIKGVSDSYASALWAVDYLLTGAEHGVYAMDFHGGTDNYCVGYTVLCGNGSVTYTPQPVYYGMLFTHLLGSGSFLPVHVSTTTSTQGAKGNMTAFALKSADGGERLMVENLSSGPADTTIRFHGAEPTSASMLTLTGPGPLATSGVQIQGAAVAADGTIHYGRPAALQCSSPGKCTVTLAPYSAAVITVR
jgi:hypothetical protein